MLCRKDFQTKHCILAFTDVFKILLIDFRGNVFFFLQLYPNELAKLNLLPNLIVYPIISRVLT